MHLLLGSSVRALTSDCCFCLFSPNLREDHSTVVLWVVLVFGPLLEQATYSLTPSSYGPYSWPTDSFHARSG